MNGVMKYIRKDFPYFKEEHFNMLSLSLAGLNFRTICLFLNLKRENFYKQRQRLITRIEQSDSPHKEFIMNKLEKVIKQKNQGA